MEDYNLIWSENFGFKITCGTISTGENKTGTMSYVSKMALENLPYSQFRLGNSIYIIPIVSSTSRDHFGSKKNPPVWIYHILYIILYICYIMYIWYWYAWKFQQWCSILYIISSCSKEKDVKLWHSASLDPRFCSNITPLRCQCRSRVASHIQATCSNIASFHGVIPF